MPNTNDMVARRKSALRAQARAARDAICVQDRIDTARKFTDAAMQLAGLSKTNICAGYYPIGSEADCLPLLHALSQQGCKTALPVVEAAGKPLIFRRWAKGDSLDRGAWNISEPQSGAATLDPDLLLVPLLAFDRRGFRLGYGGGFYDRTLDKLRKGGKIAAVGIAFAAQEVDKLPHDAYDAPLDFVLTGQGLMRF